MNSEPSTLPKPFVFVLMPLAPEFADIYKFGIKGAAEDVGAYAERLDEQIFTEGMLDRIFNQINKADVVVADMTGRNPNVFYEVGYAHALGKIVLLLTKTAEDIPFDLKHRQHTVYGGSIDVLRKDLSQKLEWAITESKRRSISDAIERFSVRIGRIDIPRAELSVDTPVIKAFLSQHNFNLRIQVRNDSAETVLGITHVYLFAEEKAPFVPTEYRPQEVRPKRCELPCDEYYVHDLEFPVSQETFPYPIKPLTANPVDAPDGLVDQYRLSIAFPALPPGAVEVSSFLMIFREGIESGEALYRLRLHSASQYHDYPFRLRVNFEALSEYKKKSTRILG
jgi:hypothetical protein